MDCDVFSRVSVDAWVPGNSVVYWSLRSDFSYTGDIHFYVDHARPGGDWECLNPETPVINSCAYTDSTKRNCGTQKQSYYRVRMITPPGDAETYHSQPQSIFGNLNRNDWLILRETARQKYLEYAKGDGQLGWLLKRRRWGVKCPTCLDYDTDERTNYNCNRCLGTGILYGYFPAIALPMSITGRAPRRKITQEQVGVMDPKQVKGECVAYPMLETEDVWVDTDTGERFFVQRLDIQSSVRGMPINYSVELRLAPFTH